MPRRAKDSLSDRFIETALAAAATPTPVFETGIPMRDGVELSADVYLPKEEGPPGARHRDDDPYDKGGLLRRAGGPLLPGARLRLRRCRRARQVKSEGEWRAFVNDGRDGHDTIEWVAAQPWCTGKVGTTGSPTWAGRSGRPRRSDRRISPAWSRRRRRALATGDPLYQWLFPTLLRLVGLHGAARITEFHGMNEIDWDEVLHCLPLEGDRRVHQSHRSDLAGHDGSRHPRRLLVGDPTDDRYQTIDVPCLHVTGWYDLKDLLGAFHHYEGMMARSPARERQRLIAGPWSHVNSRNPHSSYAEVECGPEAALTMDDIHLAWFDYWLKARRTA